MPSLELKSGHAKRLRKAGEGEKVCEECNISKPTTSFPLQTTSLCDTCHDKCTKKCLGCKTEKKRAAFTRGQFKDLNGRCTVCKPRQEYPEKKKKTQYLCVGCSKDCGRSRFSKDEFKKEKRTCHECVKDGVVVSVETKEVETKEVETKDLKRKMVGDTESIVKRAKGLLKKNKAVL